MFETLYDDSINELTMFWLIYKNKWCILFAQFFLFQYIAKYDTKKYALSFTTLSLNQIDIARVKKSIAFLLLHLDWEELFQ